MAYLRRNGLIRMEVFLGLLMVLGSILGGCEGLKCWLRTGHGRSEQTECKEESAACFKSFVGKTFTSRMCFSITDQFKSCVEKVSVKGCYRVQEDKPKLDECMGTRTRAAEVSPAPEDPLTHCFCFEDLCNMEGKLIVDFNPAGRSNPNKQVIFMTFVAAALCTFTIGVGSL